MRALAVVAVLFLCVVSPAPASVSAALVATSPRADSTLSVAPQYVRLTFDHSIAGGGPYSISVTKGDEVWSEPMIGADDTVMTVPMRPSMPAGEYLVSYQLTPPGGQAVTGQYRFSVSTSTTPVWVWIAVFLVVVGALGTAYRLARR
ncbi:copper resistance protein CopC [Lentzea sp. NPDC102401]|uniref:copper resistance CopC family protein n=1 Tax=Lentzea sp. NPDC102401 TaxID=3364128 RepID=UPI00380E8A0E